MYFIESFSVVKKGKYTLLPVFIISFLPHYFLKLLSSIKCQNQTYILKTNYQSLN